MTETPDIKSGVFFIARMLYPVSFGMVFFCFTEFPDIRLILEAFDSEIVLCLVLWR